MTLSEKGYSLKKIFDSDHEAAKEYAKELRSRGFYATVVENTTRVKGYHNYSVWARRKENKYD